MAATIDANQAASVAEELSAKVKAIDQRLAWETGPGLKGARHHLALSPEGDIELRALTERWLSRAPRPDSAWDYYPARQANPRKEQWSLRLWDAPGVTIDAASLRVAFETDSAREVVHVTLSHPAFLNLDNQQQTRAAFLTLDNVLGEDGVERWLGTVKTLRAAT